MDQEYFDPYSHFHATATTVGIELEALSYHTSKYVRCRVAANRHTSAHVLERLLKDIEPAVVANVAYNPNTPARSIEVLGFWMLQSSEHCVAIWHALLVNPHTLLFVHDYLLDKINARKSKYSKPLADTRPITKEERGILPILRAYKANKRLPKKYRMPWHITAAGWEVYAKHWSSAVRHEALGHPKLPNHLRPKKIIKKKEKKK